MYGMNYSARQYKVNSVNTSPQQLVVMCYDGIIRFLNKAEKAINEKDIEGKVKNINKALAIIDELQNSLDFQRGGDISKNLDRVYDYFNNQLMQVGMKNDTKILGHIIHLARELRSAWAKVAEEANTKSGANPTNQGIAVTG